MTISRPLYVNEHYLWRGDKPFFWLGDTCWWIQLGTPGMVDEYLADRAVKQFSVIMVDADTYGFANFEGQQPFHGVSWQQPNERYWRNLDAVLNKLDKYGFIAGLAVMWGQRYPRVFGSPAEAGRHGEWLGARYRGRDNIVWLVSGEHQAINQYRQIDDSHRAWFRAMAAGLARGGARQLMTIHPTAPEPSSSVDYHHDAWLSFNMLQSGHVSDLHAHNCREVYEVISADYGRRPVKPVLDGESCYEGTPDAWYALLDANAPRIDANMVRRKAWWTALSGAAGYTYGHDDVFCFRVPGQPQPIPMKYTFGHWRDGLQAPGASQLRYLRQLIEQRDFTLLEPDQSLILSNPLNGCAHVTAACAHDGSYALVYIPHGTPVVLSLTRLGGQALAEWYSPRAGEAIALGRLRSERLELTPPGTPGIGNDWVLVLQAV
ncbi:MAG: glycoside hydrolase family 140 protein [Anaerolineae bacterium]